ncbi:MAG: GNAT family N-acetyltransferase [Patescibacteria group bacterium]
MPTKKLWYIIKKYKVLPKNIKKQASELSRLCFNYYKETEEQKKLNADKFHNNKAIITVLALENNRVIGKAKVIKRDILYKGVKIVLGGLGGVCTLPEKRRKGIAASVVRIAFDELKNQDCDIAYLCTD